MVWFFAFLGSLSGTLVQPTVNFSNLSISTLKVDGGLENVERLQWLNLELLSVTLREPGVDAAIVEVLDDRFKSWGGKIIEFNHASIRVAFTRCRLDGFLQHLWLAGHVSVQVKYFLILADKLDDFNGLRQVAHLWSSLCGCLHFVFPSFIFQIIIINENNQLKLTTRGLLQCLQVGL